MDISENLNNSASFTGKIFNNLGNLILLIVLNIIPVINLIVLGYMAKIVKESPEEPPKLSDYGKLFVDGLLVLIAIIIYALIPIIVMGIGIFASMPTFMWGSAPSLAWSISWIFGNTIFWLGVILLFIFLIIGTMAIGNMIRTGNFSKLFAFSENWGLIKGVGLGSYLIWLVVMFVILLIVGAIGQAVPYVGGAIVGVFYYLFFGKSLALILDDVQSPTTEAL